MLKYSDHVHPMEVAEPENVPSVGSPRTGLLLLLVPRPHLPFLAMVG